VGSRDKPVEERTATGWFFVVSLALALVTVWAIYDETVTRRPWKEYQRQFNALELAAVEDSLAKAEESLDDERTKKKIEKIGAELAEAREKLQGQEYKALAARSETLKASSDQVLKELSFLRSERDEAFYDWKHALHQDREITKDKARYERLSGEVGAKEARLEEVDAELEEVRKEIEGVTEPVAKLEKDREKIFAGRDGLVKKKDAIKDRRIGIKQTLNPELGVVDRCETCHPAIDRAGFDGEQWEEPYRSHPDRDTLLGKNHPAPKYGCVICHRGQGAQIKGIGGKPFDHGRSDPYWEYPMFEAPYTESSCIACHPDEWNIDGAPTISRGRQLFYDYACYACHLTKGYESARRIGPGLTGAGSKVDRAWILAWLDDPTALRPATRMPANWPTPSGQARLDEIKAVAALLLGNSSEPPPAQAGDQDLGRRLMTERGCIGCHRPASLSLRAPPDPADIADFGPELSYLGSKLQPDWIAWYLQDPSAIYQETRMPIVTLTDQERADLAAFITSEKREAPFPPAGELNDPALIERGRELVRTFGCYGCHEVPGFEDALDVGPELDGFGDKRPTMLSFGDTVTDHKEQTWLNWTTIKLGDPRRFARERENLVMPDNGFSEDQVLALAVYLKGQRNEDVPEAYVLRLSEIEKGKEEGERLIKEYNCLGCHALDGGGGVARASFGNPGLHPPDLTGEGSKVQLAWLFQFLKKPEVLRPWLTMQMPDFGLADPDAESLVSYFMALSGEAGRFVDVPLAMPPALMAKTQWAFDELKCLQCHQLTVGPGQVLSDLAPDMALTRYRLRPAWMEEFVIDPQFLMPGTKMPTFFPLEDDEDPDSIMTPMTEWLGGDPWEQIKAIRDYLYLLESQAPATGDNQEGTPDNPGVE